VLFIALPPYSSLLETSGETSPKFWGGKIIDFRQATVFCLGHCFTDHKM